ncbi:MAG TPA: hypothetical protein ENJ82_10385 [Bacteroidetes bacterium]|nr:hypothetical protein [Bacteroidota bacterium]
MNDSSGNFEATGTVQKVWKQTIDSKVKGGRARYEARIVISLTSDPEKTEDFGGDVAFLDQVKVGDAVHIVATTKTGRKIQSIQVLDGPN